MRMDFKSTILPMRELEDTIRLTRKYTKGAFSKPKEHPIQGGDFPSRVLTEYYEVYPDLEVSWDMGAGDAWAWVWGDVTCVDVTFRYDYRDNKAKVTIQGGQKAIRELAKGIPGFRIALRKVAKDGAKAGVEETGIKKMSKGAGKCISIPV